MLEIRSANGGKLEKRSTPYEEVVEILADTESEITALGEVVTVDGVSVIPKPWSIARVAGFGTVYEMSPSGKWVKGGA